MRLYHALLVTAVALLASNASAGSVDCAMTPGDIVESSSSSAPRDSFDGFDLSNDSPVQQGSTTSSDVGSSQEVSSASGSSPMDSFDGFDSSNDSPVQQGSTTSSDVGSSQEVSSASGSSPMDSFDGFDSSNDSPIQQGSDVGASQGSAPESPIQQGSNVGASQGSAPSDASFTSSYSGPTPDFPEYGNSQGSAPESPIQQGSDVGASQGSAPESPIQQGSNVGASQGSAPSDASFTSSYSGPTPDFPEDGNSQGSAPESPIQQGSDVGASQGSAPESPIQQGSNVGASQGSAPSDASFTSSYSGPTPDFPEYGNSQGSAPESPIQQGSDVGASQGSAPDTPIQQGSAPSDASFTSSYSGPTPDFPEYGNSQGSAPESPIQQGSDVGASQGSAPDSPVQQTSTTASGSQGSTMDAPVTQDSTAASGVDASQASTSASASASNSDDIKQGIVTPAGPADDDDASQKTDVAGESDINFQTTQVPTATTRAPTVVSSASGSSSSSVPTNNNSTTAATTKPSTTSADNSKLCAKPRIEITKVDVGATVDANEDEVALKPVAIAAIPSGGSRIAFQSGDSVVVQELDASDKLVSGSTVKVPLHDFADIYADEKGFVILGTRDAEGGGTLNCGNPSNLCGSAPNPAVPCYDMYMVRYDGAKESWATKLTSSSASLPPYSTGKTGPDVYMIWWYAHHGRIAFNGKNWAAYFGAAISTSEGGCINIHQGDRMKVVDATGKITADEDSFDWGCSHSGYERVTYDNRTDNFAAICKTDSNNRIMPPKDWGTTIYPVDLAASNLGDIVPDSSASSKKYWATVSNGNGDNAKVHLIHFALNAASSEDITLGGTDANERAPHLASIGSGGLLAMWEGSSSGGDLAEGGDRTIYAQVLDASNGKSISDKVTVDKSVVGNRYQALKSYPDGSVAYLSKGASDTSVQVVRFYGC